MSAVDLVVATVAALAVFLVVRPLAGRALQWGIVDVPRGRKAHRRATPYLGGTAVLIGLGVALAIERLVGSWAGAWSPSTIVVGLAVGVVGAWGLGTLDDVRGLGALVKALVQLAVVATWFAVAGVDGAVPWVGAALVFFAMNGTNLLDNTDGLCAASALPSFFGLAIVSVVASPSLPHAITAPVVPLAIAGALLGFLPHNLPRARIFLGDGGSLVIGFLLGALVVQFTIVAHGLRALPAALAFLALPIADTTTVVVTRIRAGRPIWVGDRNHLSHRLHAAGWSERVALLILVTGAALGAAAGTWLVLR